MSNVQDEGEHLLSLQALASAFSDLPRLKCDGGKPCGACRRERRRQGPCVYSEKVIKLQQATEELRRRTALDRTDQSSPAQPSLASALPRYTTNEPSNHVTVQDHPVSKKARISWEESSLGVKQEGSDDESVSPFTSLSLCGTIEEFKKLKPTRGSAAPVVNRCNGFEAVDISMSTSLTTSSADETVDCRPQIPELTTSITEITILKDRLDAIWITVTQGRLSRAWVDLASLVREAELLDTTDALDGISVEEQQSWRQLWTNILDLESQLGLALGRPTCLVLPRQDGSKNSNDELVIDDSELDTTRLDLFKHIQAALSLDSRGPSVHSDFYHKALSTIRYESFNQVGLCTTEDSSASARDLQLNTHLFFMVLYSRLASVCDIHAREGLAPIFAGAESSDTKSSNSNQPRQKLTYCRLMFKSAKFVVSGFLNLLSDDQDVIGQNWTRCHGAFIAATLLGIAKLRHEVEWDSTTDLLRKLELAFSKLSQTSPNCGLFKTAIQRLQDLNSVEEPTSEVTRNKHSGTKHRKRFAANSTETSPAGHRDELTRISSHLTSSPSRPLKRNREQMESATQLSQALITSFNSGVPEDNGSSPLRSVNPSFAESTGTMDYYPDTNCLFPQPTSFLSNGPQSATTSFCESDAGLSGVADMACGHPGPPFAFPFPYDLVHPPMLLYNPAMLSSDRVMMSNPIGTQFFQPTTRIGPNHAAIEQLNAAPPARDLEVASNQKYHDHSTQGHLADSSMEQKAGHLLSPGSPHKPAHAKMPGMNRRHSTDTIGFVADPMSTPALDSWPQHHADAIVGDGPATLRRPASTDPTEQVQPHGHPVPPEEFYVPMPLPPTDATQAMYHPAQHLAATTGHPYFGVEMPAVPEQSHDVSPFRSDYAFSCNHQHFVHEQEQWRQMSVNAGVPGGP